MVAVVAEGAVESALRPTADVATLPGAVKSTSRFASLTLINLKCVAPAAFVVSAAIRSTCSVRASLLDLILKTSADTCSAGDPSRNFHVFVASCAARECEPSQ